MSTKQNLIAAKQLIEDGGLVQGIYYDGKGCYCTIGAVQEIIGAARFFDLESDEPNELVALSKALEKLTGKAADGLADPIFAWNDTEGRTKEEVLELFDEAIRIAGE